MSLCDQAIVRVFNGCFLKTHQTQLCGGASEPLYEPLDPQKGRRNNILWYREDFAASALHESAHWCIAGPKRRQLMDFGYSYVPPPRNEAQQQQFFSIELRTQTLESLFAQAAGIVFQPSADNLGADLHQFSASIDANRAQVKAWLDTPAGARAHSFINALYLYRQQS